jgi:hypothetical protein
MSKGMLLATAMALVSISAVAVEQKNESKSANQNNDFKITFSGTFDAQVGYVSQSAAFKYSSPTNSPIADQAIETKSGTVGDAEIILGINARRHGLKYGGEITMNADASPNDDLSATIGRTTFVYGESVAGRVELGAIEGASKRMAVRPTVVATGGAYKGNWREWANGAWCDLAGGSTTTYSTNGVFIIRAQLPVDYSTGNAPDQQFANKISYYTPKIANLSLGVSYTPDTAAKGTTSTLGPKNVYDSSGFGTNTTDYNTNMGYYNVWTAGAVYEIPANNINVKLSAIGQLGKAKLDMPNLADPAVYNARHNLRAYELGALASLKSGLSVGLSYGSWGKSGQLNDGVSSNKATTYWTAGLGYNFADFVTTLTYFKSDKGGIENSTYGNNKGKTNRATAYSLGVEYKGIEGIAPYAEVATFKYRQGRSLSTNGSATINKGSFYVVGTRVMF